MLGDTSNTVSGCLSKSGTSVTGKTTDRLNDSLEVFWGEISWSQVLNHVIKDEEGELVALLLVAREAGRDDVSAKGLHESSHGIFVRLKEAAHELSSSDLQIKLIGVLLFDESHIVSIESIILILDLLVGEGVVLGDSLEGLGDDADGFLTQVVNFFGCLLYTSPSPRD